MKPPHNIKKIASFLKNNPEIPRYEIDCCGNSITQVEGGPWVQYNDHVTAMESMRSEIEKLNLVIEEL